jgi:esterase/lipase
MHLRSELSIPMPGKPIQIQADLYGEGGTRGVVLAHGGRFNKESWRKQAQVLADHGFIVLAVRFRGDRLNPDGTPSAEGSDADNTADVLAAVAYLHRMGAKTVSAVGGSLGGDAVGDADAQSAPGNIDRIILAAAGGDEPKKLIILEGSAHAQFLFDTDQGPRVMREIPDFLSSL